MKTLLAIFALSSSMLYAQAGGHGGGIGGGGGHAFGGGGHISSGGGIAGGAHMAPRSSPSSSPGRFNNPGSSFSNGAARPLNQGYSSGNWNSAGFIPNRSNGNSVGYNNGYGRRGYRRGYGYENGAYFPFLGGLALSSPGFYDTSSGFYDTDPGFYDNGNDPNQNGYGPGDTSNGARQPYAQNAQDMGPGGDTGYYPAGNPPPAAGQNPPIDPRYVLRPGYAGDMTAANVPPASTDAAQARTDGLSHPKVKLIFKDGRKPLEIQNYALTSTRVFVRDNGTERTISIGELDLPATISANDQNGVDFALPVKQ